MKTLGWVQTGSLMWFLLGLRSLPSCRMWNIEKGALVYPMCMQRFLRRSL